MPYYRPRSIRKYIPKTTHTLKKYKIKLKTI